ncbi:hypothetical protein K2173_021982 [Erythroxylum novogranatense]|uniref:Uncharacterized protein n=1 Tax=Erythroxylum novogranatense TaxID=1862640 RepID=A0AAV8T3P1_9ROSI|nr:hypothetical protein K2173_021982 [Erythroxylum novogranatense]
MKGTSTSQSPAIETATATAATAQVDVVKNTHFKPKFRPAQDDTKPPLQDPILRSDPIESEEAVLRLPPFPISRLK